MFEEKKKIILQRDCYALLIPSATPLLVPTGTLVEITQQKGGSVTIAVNGQLARIDEKDIDALGLKTNDKSNQTETLIATGPVDVDQVWEKLKCCYDPEIPVNVVDLGLIYECKVIASEDKTKNAVHIQMTLTAPGCNMGPVLADDIKKEVLRVANVTSVEVEIVFEPIWNQDMMSDVAKLELGLF